LSTPTPTLGVLFIRSIVGGFAEQVTQKNITSVREVVTMGGGKKRRR
jgi:hypothetical protein